MRETGEWKLDSVKAEEEGIARREGHNPGQGARPTGQTASVDEEQATLVEVEA